MTVIIYMNGDATCPLAEGIKIYHAGTGVSRWPKYGYSSEFFAWLEVV